MLLKCSSDLDRNKTAHKSGLCLFDICFVYSAYNYIVFDTSKDSLRYTLIFSLMCLQVVGGDYDLSVVEESEQFRYIANYHIHPDYNQVNMSNDLALIELDESFSINGTYIEPITLPATPGSYENGVLFDVKLYNSIFH